MKTVWCIMDYSNRNGNNLIAIFATKDKAIEWLRDQINHGWTQAEIDWCDIEEWFVD